MRTVADLKAAGFRFAPSSEAFGCTEIHSDHPFWYYNQNFYSRMDEVHEHLEAAKPQGSAYRLIVAGAFQDADVFAFNLLTEDRKALLDTARAAFVLHRNEMLRAADDYEDALAHETD